MLPLEHSAILLTCINWYLVLKTNFCVLFETGLTVLACLMPLILAAIFIIFLYIAGIVQFKEVDIVELTSIHTLDAFSFEIVLNKTH